MMVQSVLDKAGEQITETSRKASAASCAIANALGDSLGAARRVAKQSGDAAEEFLDDTTKRLQRHPVETVVTTFALGIAVGALISWIVRRR
jgi:ElaB/YqjD/DUF883 family membrane-anchored ribosome-binding protein